MADLSWTAETGYDCSETGWIKINGSQSATGTGSATPSVKISPASSANDCTSGYILFRTSNGDSKKIPITRCMPDCGCSSIGYNDRIDGNTYETASTTVTVGTYNVNECSDGVNFVYGGSIFENMAKNNGTITAVIKENSGNARSDFYKITYNGASCFEGRIIQNGSVSECFSDTGCNSSISPTQISPIPCTGGTYSYTITASDCWSLEDVYYNCGGGSNGWFTVEPGSDWRTGNIIAYKNDYGDVRDGLCTFVLQNVSNGTECSNLTVNLYQEACCTCGNITLLPGDEDCSLCNCSCSKLILTSAVSGGSITIGNEGIGETLFATYEDCISDDSINVVLSDNWLHKRVENGEIFISVDTSEENRLGQVTINYGIDCDETVVCSAKTISIFQQRLTPCKCTDITDFPTESDTYSVTIGGSVGDSTSVTYSESCSMYIKNNASSFVNVSKNSNSIEITANSELASGSRSGTIEILTIQDGTVCKTINVTQQGSGGGCVAGTYNYTLHVPQIPSPGAITGPYDIYLCKTHQISNPLEAQSLALSGGTKLEKVGDYYHACDFEVDGSGNLVRLIGATDLINFVPTGGGNVVTTNFEIDKGFYICAVQIDDPTKFYPFGTQASLRTGVDIKCNNYTQEVTN